MRDVAPSSAERAVAAGRHGGRNRDGEDSFVGRLAVAWAILGVAGLFGWAVVRLGTAGIATMREGLDAGQWMLLVLCTAGFVYVEGYQALYRRWVPRMIGRAHELRTRGTALRRILAPLYALSLIGVRRPGLMRAWLGTVAIVGAVLVVRALPEPWRGIVDFAVAAALALGLAGIVRRLRGTPA